MSCCGFGILHLVDDDVPEALALRQPGRGMLLEQPHRLRDLIAMVDERTLRQEPLVATERPRDLRLCGGLIEERRHGLPCGFVRVLPDGGPRPGLQPCRIGGQVIRADALLLGPAEELDEGDEEPGGVPERQVVDPGRARRDGRAGGRRPPGG